MSWRIVLTAGATIIALAAAYNYRKMAQRMRKKYGYVDEHGWLFWLLLVLALANGVILYGLVRG
jgi:hypothetical protein